MLASIGLALGSVGLFFMYGTHNEWQPIEDQHWLVYAGAAGALIGVACLLASACVWLWRVAP